MGRVGAIDDFDVLRVDGAARRAARDQVVVEQALELRIDGCPGAVTMRTPGADEELVRGLLYAEGVITAADDIRGLVWLGEQVVDVTVRGPVAAARRLPARALVASSSCGVCGKVSLASLQVRAPVVDAALSVSADVLAGLPGALRDAQVVFADTGGLHAAGLFTADGRREVAREDVGRHNAVDKVVGWALAHRRVPLGGSVLVVSGRVSYEIVQKAVVAGVPVVAAVSAPSSLAIDVARQFGVTLCGFVRGGRFTIYTHPARIQ